MIFTLLFTSTCSMWPSTFCKILNPYLREKKNIFLGFREEIGCQIFVCVCAYFNFPIFSNMFCERFSSLDWKTTENNVIIFKKTTSLITQFLYQVNWFLEQEDNSKLERTTIEEQLSSESWSFVTKINQFKSLVRVLEKFGAMQTRTPEQTNSS